MGNCDYTPFWRQAFRAPREGGPPRDPPGTLLLYTNDRRLLSWSEMYATISLIFGCFLLFWFHFLYFYVLYGHRATCDGELRFTPRFGDRRFGPPGRGGPPRDPPGTRLLYPNDRRLLSWSEMCATISLIVCCFLFFLFHFFLFLFSIWSQGYLRWRTAIYTPFWRQAFRAPREGVTPKGPPRDLASVYK